MAEQSDKRPIFYPLSQVTPKDRDRGNLNNLTPFAEVRDFSEEKMKWNHLTRDEYLEEMQARLGPENFPKFRDSLTEKRFKVLRRKMLEFFDERIKYTRAHARGILIRLVPRLSAGVSHIASSFDFAQDFRYLGISLSSTADQLDTGNQCGSRELIRKSKKVFS